jgi:DNA replication regulator DPB11
VDSTATHGHAVEYPSHSHSNPSSHNPSNKPSTANTEAKDAARRSANEQIEKFLKEGNIGWDVGDDILPSSTQLQYEDPESREYKERVMARMLGEKVDEERIRGRRKERVATIGDGDLGERPLRRRGRLPAGG